MDRNIIARNNQIAKVARNLLRLKYRKSVLNLAQHWIHLASADIAAQL